MTRDLEKKWQPNPSIASMERGTVGRNLDGMIDLLERSFVSRRQITSFVLNVVLIWPFMCTNDDPKVIVNHYTTNAQKGQPHDDVQFPTRNWFVSPEGGAKHTV